MIIDIPGQFRKLCCSYSRCIDLTVEQMLEIVESRLEGCRKLGAGERPHWAYDLNTHIALNELRGALHAECETARRRVA